jgi:hypothetical protein
MWNQVEQALNQSATNVLTGMVGLLPGTIALLVSLILAALIGWGLGALMRRTLNGLDFDRRVAGWGGRDFAGWAGDKGPAVLVSRLLTWIVIFVGFLVGLAAFDPTLTSQLAMRLFGSAMDLLTAVVILIIGNILARVVSRGVLISLVNMNVQHPRLLSLAVKWLVVILSAAMALDHLSIGGRIVELAFGILFGGIVLALALAVGLRSKDFADWSMARRPDKGPDDGGQPLHHL